LKPGNPVISEPFGAASTDAKFKRTQIDIPEKKLHLSIARTVRTSIMSNQARMNC